MRRVKVKLGDLKWNPWRKKIGGGKLDPAKISRLEESIEQSGYWEGTLVRENADGKYELCFGHARTQAAKNVLGADYVVELPLVEKTDEEMFQMMANENATIGEDGSDRTADKIDTVVTARAILAEKYNKENLVYVWDEKKRQGEFRPHTGSAVENPKGGGDRQKGELEPTSHRTLSRFLGEKNWHFNKVGELLKLDERLAPELKELVLESSGERKRDKGGEPATLGQRTAQVLSTLATGKDDKAGQKLQVKVFNELKKMPGRVTQDDVTRVVKAVKAAPESKKTAAAITETKRVVAEVKMRSVPSVKRDVKKEEKQAQDITKHLAAMLPEMRRTGRLYEKLVALIEALGENPLLSKEYRSHHAVVDFFKIGTANAALHARIMQPVRQPVRRALNG